MTSRPPSQVMTAADAAAEAARFRPVEELAPCDVELAVAHWRRVSQPGWPSYAERLPLLLRKQLEREAA